MAHYFDFNLMKVMLALCVLIILLAGFLLHSAYRKLLEVQQNTEKLSVKHHSKVRALTTFIAAGIAANYMPFFERHRNESVAAQLRFTKLYVEQTIIKLRKTTTLERLSAEDVLQIEELTVLVFKICARHVGSPYVSISTSTLFEFLKDRKCNKSKQQ